MALSGSFTRRRVAAWLLWLCVLIHLPIAFVAVRHSYPPSGDFDNYYGIGTRAGRPYVDFQVEFPLATAQTFRTLAPLSGSRERFGVTLVVLNLVADLAIVGALAWGWGTEAAACYAFVVIPLIDLFFLRMDLWPTALATIAAAAWQRKHLVVAATALVAGAAFKLWPLMLLPLLTVYGGTRRRVAPLAAAVASGVLVLAAWLWVAGASGLYQVLTFRGARGWEIESTVGAVWMLFEQDSMRVESGAWRIGTSSGAVSIVLFVLGAVPCLLMLWRGARTRHLGAGWAGGISMLLVMSALLSAQYSAWIAPASGIAWVERDRRIAVLTGVAVFLTNLVYKSFHPLLQGAPRALALVLLRNGLLAVLVIDAARTLWRAKVTAETECC
jgi:hypothetical protein